MLECRGPADMSEECINSYYYQLSLNNEWEWVIALYHDWWAQAWLALMGPILIPLSFIITWVILLIPDAKPDIDQMPSWREQPITSVWYILVSTTAMTAEPALFFMTQLFTWGNSDLRDFAIIYMSTEEAFIYYIINTIWLCMAYLPALAWVAMFWWAYMLEMCITFFMVILDDDGPDGNGRGRGGRGRGRGGNGGPGGDGDGPDGNDTTPTD